jgi:hypothetical protein
MVCRAALRIDPRTFRVRLDRSAARLNRERGYRRERVQLFRAVRRYRPSQRQGSAHVESGNPGSGLPRGGRFSARQRQAQHSQKRHTAKNCGAMSEQGADSGRGNAQVPQQLAQLVGYRDPDAQLLWIRPRRS